MKKRSKSLIFLLSLLMLAGCEDGYDTGFLVKNGDFKAVGDFGTYDVLRDLRTGCLYLESHHSSDTLVPFFGEDGEVQGCGEGHLELKYD